MDIHGEITAPGIGPRDLYKTSQSPQNEFSRVAVSACLICLHEPIHLVFGVSLVGESKQAPLVRLLLFIGDETEMAEVVMGLAEMGDVVGVVV